MIPNVMNRLFKMFALSMLLLAGVGTAYAQTYSGHVLDEQGEAVIGATVMIKGTGVGTATNVEGYFSLDGEPGKVLVFSSVGYTTLEVRGAKGMTVVLKEDTELLDELVVVGYGQVKKKDVTTAISSVSTDEINSRPIVSTAQALQGKAAGVSVIQPNGMPGGETSIRVRGTTSFNGSNSPLYVVDGVPVDNINFLAPTDIADLQILKDASSAAIYGSRAANGVILITTKSGESGRTRISLNMQYGVTAVSNKITPLNTEQYRELQEEIGIVKLPEGLEDQTDWFAETYRPGSTQNYQLAMSSGNDKLRYYLSLGYLNDKGILPVAFYNRYNFRVNVDNKINDWLTMNANISYSDYSNNGIISGQGANRGGVVLSVVNTPTYAPVYDPNNPDHFYNNFYGVGNITNPLENMARSENNKGKENRLIASGSLTVAPLKGLTYKTTFSLDRRNAVNTSFLDPDRTSWGRNQHGEGSDNRNTNTVTTWDNVLNYNTYLNDDHHLDLMAGSSWTQSDYNNSWINASHFRNGLIQTLNVANKISWTGTGTGSSQWAILSFFGRASYNYQGKYLLTANIRTDGSSKLHPDKRWGVFPSVSAAWRLSAEPFMASTQDWLDDLKIRVGWGETGNQSGIGDYAYLMRYSTQRIEWFKEGQENALPTVKQSNLPTPDLTWETTRQFNVGVDFTAFRNRLMINLDYYYKDTRDMLMHVTLPPGAAAANSIVRNEGEMINRGFELNLSSTNIRTNDFEWNTDFNISFNRNKLTALELQKVYYAAQTTDALHDHVVRNEPGRPLGGFWGYISDGVDPETGELIYRDLNNDGKVTSSDKTYIGDPNPDFIFGLTNKLEYKGFMLSLFFQGSYGNDVYNASRMDTEGMYDGRNQSDRVLDRWRIPGQITDVPKANFNIQNSTYFVEDGSFIRLKDLTLAYSFAPEVISRIGLTQLRPFFTATNLFTITRYTGMDPEVNQWGGSGAVQGIDWGTYPHSRNFMFGVNIEF